MRHPADRQAKAVVYTEQLPAPEGMQPEQISALVLLGLSLVAVWVG